MNSTQISSHIKQVWVCFTNETDIPWLRRFLKRGFRHCSVLMHDGDHWVTLDPLSNYTDVMVHKVPADFNLTLWLRDRGYTLVPATVSTIKKQAPLMPFTCVEAVKRVIGLHERFILTPWQLYRHLTRQANIQSSHPTLHSKQGDYAWEV